MDNSLVWSKYGENYKRVYKSKGRRASYQIGLDPVEDRWVLYVNSIRSVDDFYFVTNAQKMADAFEAHGKLLHPPGMRPRPDNGAPHILHPTSGVPGLTGAHGVGYLHGGAQPRKQASRGRMSKLQPDMETLTDRLHQLVINSGITPLPKDAAWISWNSGVYALIDCIFSARSNYEFVVLPLLERLNERPTLRDHTGLTFSEFLNDVDQFGEDKFGRYADEVMTRNKLSGRLKVEICYEACQFFVEHDIQTIADLRAMETPLNELILNDFQETVHGIGPALSHYLLTLLGFEDHVKLDPMIIRFWARMGNWVPRRAQDSDYDVVLETFRAVAARMGTTPARLDNAIWRYESNGQS